MERYDLAMWRWLNPVAALLVLSIWFLSSQFVGGDDIDRFCAYMPRTQGGWANGRWDHFNEPANTPVKTLVLDAVSHLYLTAGPLSNVSIIRIKEPTPSSPFGPGQPLLGLINSDQGKKLVIVQYNGGTEYFFRVVNTDGRWSFLDGGGSLPLPVQ
jgi:hypothetical protein